MPTFLSIGQDDTGGKCHLPFQGPGTPVRGSVNLGEIGDDTFGHLCSTTPIWSGSGSAPVQPTVGQLFPTGQLT